MQDIYSRLRSAVIRYSARGDWHPGDTMSIEEIDRLANRDTDLNPSAEQIKAGNYRKAKVRIHGLDVSIENPKGSIRRGTNKAGKTWEQKVTAHYGYIKRTVSDADGDAIDLFIGPNPSHPIVYVIDQYNPHSGDFDENKCVVGVASKEAAKELYHSNYESGWKGFGGIKAMHTRDFKEWIMNGDTSKPLSSREADVYSRIKRAIDHYSRDVSSEARDEKGEWTTGGGSAAADAKPAWFKGKKADQKQPGDIHSKLKDAIKSATESLKGSGKTVKDENGKLAWFPKPEESKPKSEESPSTEKPKQEPQRTHSEIAQSEGPSEFGNARKAVNLAKAMEPEKVPELEKQMQQKFREALGLTNTTAKDTRDFEARLRAGIANYSKSRIEL